MAKEKLSFDAWNTKLRACCGHYYAKPTRARDKSDRFKLLDTYGLATASINCTLDRIERTQRGIRRDDAEHFFLLHQRSGRTGVRHCGGDALMEEGDFLLLDSTRAADLVFDGQASDFLSVHIPRTLFLAGRAAPFVGAKIGPRHPLHASLRNLILDQSGVDRDQLGSNDFLDFVAMIFGPDPSSVPIDNLNRQGGRMRYLSQIVDQNLRNHDFSIDDLAALVGRSRRQLQRDLSASGTSFTHLLRERRLRHFVQGGRRQARVGLPINIAHLAQNSGFSDQSHFNRLFRDHYQTSPRAFFEGAA